NRNPGPAVFENNVNNQCRNQQNDVQEVHQHGPLVIFRLGNWCWRFGRNMRWFMAGSTGGVRNIWVSHDVPSVVVTASWLVKQCLTPSAAQDAHTALTDQHNPLAHRLQHIATACLLV